LAAPKIGRSSATHCSKTKWSSSRKSASTTEPINYGSLNCWAKSIMSRWRNEAFDRLPELRKLLQTEKSAYSFLSELVDRLHKAYAQKDEDLIRRIYDYAKWCLDLPRGKDSSDDLPTIVTVSFFEHLPQHAEVRRDVGRWLPRKDVEGMKQVFLYHGSEEQFQEMLSSCCVTKFQKSPTRR
jgi:hypothetical protein